MPCSISLGVRDPEGALKRHSFPSFTWERKERRSCTSPWVASDRRFPSSPHVRQCNCREKDIPKYNLGTR